MTPRPSSPTVGIVGLGYVGMAAAAAFAHYGVRVVGFDLDAGRIQALRKGTTPILEEGLGALLRSAFASRRLLLSDSLADLAQRCEVIFLCVQTPATSDGAIDLSYLAQAALDLGRALHSVGKWRLVVVKSTVVPGTAEGLVSDVLKNSGPLRPGRDFAVASNPEFLAEGTLVKDALHPARIVIGVSEAKSSRLLRALYRRFPAPVRVLPVAAAELVKYASNAMLALRVSYANEMARLARKAGVDIDPVLTAVGEDPRIGPHFLRAGPGFGGSCFSKDVRALASWARDHGVETPVLTATLDGNELQALHVVELTEEALGGLSGRRVALLGLSFKPGTSDVRDSRAYPIMEALLRDGADVVLHDPHAADAFRHGLSPSATREIGQRLSFAPSLKAALRGADGAIVQADWPEYRRLPPHAWRTLRGRVVIDTRRTLARDRLRAAGVRCVALGVGER